MFITIEIPEGVAYTGTRSWYIDEDDNWSVQDLNADVSYAVRTPLTASGLSPDALVAEALADGASVAFVEG